MIIDENNCPICKIPWGPKVNTRTALTNHYQECPNECGLFLTRQHAVFSSNSWPIIYKILDKLMTSIWWDGKVTQLQQFHEWTELPFTPPFDITYEQLKLYLTSS